MPAVGLVPEHGQAAAAAAAALGTRCSKGRHIRRQSARNTAEMLRWAEWTPVTARSSEGTRLSRARAVVIARGRRLVGWLHRHRVGRHVLICLTAVAGALIAVTLWGSVQERVGPVQATFRLQPALHGGTEIDVPPLGTLSVHSHAGPLHVRATVTSVDLQDAQRVLDGEQTTDQIEAQVNHDVHHAMTVLIAKWVTLALLGGAGAVLAVYRRPRPVVLGASVVAAAMMISGIVVVSTWRSRAFSNPRFSGVLRAAPTVIGSVEDIPEKFDSYRRELAKIVTNISKLYDATRTLPNSIAANAIPVLWVSDIHDNPEAFTVMQSIVAEFGAKAVVDTGDISDHGTAAEDRLFDPISQLGVPYVYVRGNHDSLVTQRYLARLGNVHVLDNGAVEQVAGLRWAGTGDPNFTPDRSVDYGHGSDPALLTAGTALTESIQASRQPVDVALVHEPTMAGPLAGSVPLVLDGHVHHRAHRRDGPTVTLTQGSSGGAGLRNLEGSQALDLEMSVLYFDPASRQLVAVDDITLSGLGGESVQIQRHRASYYRDGSVDSTPSGPATRSPPGEAPSTTR